MVAVKRKRRYESPLRADQARLTRSAILTTARRRFLRDGYADTTIAAIAEEVGVSLETVYKAFRNKPGVLKAVIDVSIVDDEEPVPMLERDLVRRIESEPDPRRKLTIYGEHLRSSTPRRAPLELLVRDAAMTDPGAAKLAEQLRGERLSGMERFADHLRRSRSLRPGVSRNAARDVLWTLISAELYELLVLQRGWSVGRYTRWVIDSLSESLLP